MRVHAPAKINLHLRVGSVRPDGFHPLLTWMCAVGLFDTLDVERAGEPGVRLSVDREQAHTRPWPRDDGGGNDAAGDVPIDVPADATNLVVRAVAAWSGEARSARAGAGEGPTGVAEPRDPDHPATTMTDPWPGLTIRLTKRIPVGAGLGGGSSDAASTLLALNDIDQANWPPTRLAELGAGLGSDVPFFFFGPSSVCTGRGEVVRPVARPRAKWAALYLPGVHVSTPAVYRQFDAMRLGSDEDISAEPDWSAWSQLPADRLMAQLVNDLEAPAFVVCPELSELRSRLEKNTGRIVRMSGSGSTLFTLFDEKADAIDAVARAAWDGRIEVVPVGIV